MHIALNFIITNISTIFLTYLHLCSLRWSSISPLFVLVAYFYKVLEYRVWFVCIFTTLFTRLYIYNENSNKRTVSKLSDLVYCIKI